MGHNKANHKPGTNKDRKRDRQKEQRKDQNSLATYSNIAFKMAAVIFLGVWGGNQLDIYFGIENHIITLFTSLISVALAIYIVIRDLI